MQVQQDLSRGPAATRPMTIFATKVVAAKEISTPQTTRF